LAPRIRLPPRAALFPYTPLFRSRLWSDGRRALTELETLPLTFCHLDLHPANMFSVDRGAAPDAASTPLGDIVVIDWAFAGLGRIDRKSTRLNSSHVNISYAVFRF